MTSQSDDTKQHKDAALAAELEPLRTQIDSIASQLLTLLSDRAKVAQEVGEVKKRYSSPAFRPAPMANSVDTAAGQIVLTRMPSARTSRSSDPASPTCANLVAA